MSDRKTLHSGVVVATGVGAEMMTSDVLNTAIFELDVTATATGVGDLLDVFVQTYFSNSSNWVDVLHFTQVLGNGGAARFLGKINGNSDEAVFEVGTLLAVDTVRNLLGNKWRARWDIVDATGSSFTFSLLGLFDE